MTKDDIENHYYNIVETINMLIVAKDEILHETREHIKRQEQLLKKLEETFQNIDFVDGFEGIDETNIFKGE